MTDAAVSHQRAAAAAAAADASMHDMLRIMDVASALRRERETAETQLDVATQKARLRERLLATAQAAGEPVTPAEVDAAIEQYFARQHVYADPPPSLRRLCANAWVLRVPIGVLLLVVGVAAAIVVAAASSFGGDSDARPPATAPAPATVPSAPVPAPAPPPAGPADDELATAWATFQRTVAATEKAAGDDDARGRVRAIASDGEVAHAGGRVAALRDAQRALETLAARLAESYVVCIVSRPGEDSGVERLHAGRTSGLYLIVEAVDDRGRVLPRDIREGEGGGVRTVRKWGEQVPEAVWDRVVADKSADGVVDEATFARKVRGRADEDVVIVDASRKPLRRGRQIVSW